MKKPLGQGWKSKILERVMCKAILGFEVARIIWKPQVIKQSWKNVYKTFSDQSKDVDRSQMLKVLKVASEEASRVARNNISNLRNQEDKDPTGCGKGYWRRDRCASEEDESLSDKNEEPGATSKQSCTIGSYEALEKSLGGRHRHENFSFNYD